MRNATFFNASATDVCVPKATKLQQHNLHDFITEN